ncbi:hypothetical protein ABXS75_10920 [Roseburia hominis]
MLQIAETKMTIWKPEVSRSQKNTIAAIGSTCKSVHSAEGEPQFIYQNWTVYFKGAAYEPAQQLRNQERIRVIRGIVENKFDKKSNRQYVWCTVFEFEVLKKGTGDL